MINFIFIISCIIFLMFVCAAILHTIYRKAIVMNDRVDHYFGKREIMEKSKKQQEKTYSVIRKYWEMGARQVSKTLARKDQKKLDMILRDAGSKLSAVEFRLIQLVISISSGVFIFLLVTPLSDKDLVVSFLALSVAFLGYRYPLFYLAKKKTKRVKMIDKEMADFFDMVSLLLEAGVGLEGAISNVCSKTKGPLSEEFKQVLDEMQRGKSRREALDSLRKRVPSHSLQSAIMSIIQADHLGIGMAKVIHNLTIRIREQSRESAREQAMKAPIKMLFPMILFIFPSLFIVILGPIIVKIIVEGLG